MNRKKKVIIITAILSVFIIINVLVIRSDSNKICKEESDGKNQLEYIKETFQDSNSEGELKDGILGILQIDKINVKGIVKEGSTSEVLKDYIGHIENTAIYNGNIGLAAHNRGNIHSYFSKINQLSKGDQIKYTTIFGENYYRVDNIKEINEDDWSLLQDTNEDKLTLITCVKDKRSKRLCVQATREIIDL